MNWKKAQQPIVAPEGMKILCLDIETQPALAYVWDIWDVNVNLDALISSQEMICWAAKWLHKPGIEFRSTYHDGKERMLQRMWDLLNEADAVVHYNGKRFDIPHLNREFLQAGYDPPAPFHQIDLLRVVRQRFKFISNKLLHVSKELGIGDKIKHEGFKLWIGCWNDDEGAWDRMSQYNIQDTVLLEKLYDKLRPWITNHPSFGALTGTDCCPRCGSEDLEWRGYATTRTGKYHRFRCNECGGWGRETRRTEGTGLTEVVL